MRTSRVVPPCLAWLHSPSDCPHRLSHLETAAASCPAEKGRKEEMRRGEKKGGETRGKDKRRKGMRRHEQIRLDDFRWEKERGQKGGMEEVRREEWGGRGQVRM
jgi:hypothetical protein